MKNATSETPLSVVMLGASGAVGGEALGTLLMMPKVEHLSLLGRREIPNQPDPRIQQHIINIFEPSSYQSLVADHDVAICTLGVGQPSKTSKEDFIKIDKIAVIDFAKACKAAGVRHFELLSSVGISSNSSNFFLRTKGELVQALEALEFEQLSIFQPSMILTPTNRYGFTQAVTLLIWPVLQPLLLGSLRKYRGIRVEQLGKAIALNILDRKQGVEKLVWDDFQTIIDNVKL
ncbi:MAG: NAD(P)H-binding protein [Saprospiraceae bacterium]|nr:NAD(P)H-binding protein [Saprospiraceae bacterium]